ncbi:MAG: hypothetical protein ABI625_05230 [bacterium]
MTEHLTFDQLCDLEDGALDSADSAAARAHMKSCAECASRHADLAALGAASAALPREIAQPDDLWLDIRGQLTPRRAGGATRVRGWNVRHLAAAAVIIAVASSVITALVLRPNTPLQSASTPAAAVSPDAPGAELPARLASAEHGYARSVEALQRTLDERRDSLAPSTVATVERSLRIADSAIAEARTALARDPANRALVALFASNYERKIDLLRRATELAPRT